MWVSYNKVNNSNNSIIIIVKKKIKLTNYTWSVSFYFVTFIFI